MDSTVISLADAVTAALTGASLSRPIEAVRLHKPDYTLDDLAALRVAVVPGTVGFELVNRSSVQSRDYAVTVGVAQKVDTGDRSAVDGLLALAEEILEFLSKTTLEAIGARPVEVAWTPLATEQFDQQGVFLSVITVTYRLLK